MHGFGYRCQEAAAAPEKGSCVKCIAQCLDEVKKQILKGEERRVSATLKEMKPGEKGRIEQIGGEGAVRRRIADMGMTKGSLVEVVRVAPLGDPIDVKIKGYHLSLRKDEAAGIQVSRVPEAGG